MSNGYMVPPRPQYWPEEGPVKPKVRLKRGKPMRRVSKELAREKRQNDQWLKAFLTYNPVCACGCGNEAECPEHIASGSAGKDATRFDSDLCLPSTLFCNSVEVWHDTAVWTKPRKLALKLATIVRKFNAATTKPVALEQVVVEMALADHKLLEYLKERLSQ